MCGEWSNFGAAGDGGNLNSLRTVILGALVSAVCEMGYYGFEEISKRGESAVCFDEVG